MLQEEMKKAGQSILCSSLGLIGKLKGGPIVCWQVYDKIIDVRAMCRKSLNSVKQGFLGTETIVAFFFQMLGILEV